VSQKDVNNLGEETVCW